MKISGIIRDNQLLISRVFAHYAVQTCTVSGLALIDKVSILRLVKDCKLLKRRYYQKIRIRNVEESFDICRGAKKPEEGLKLRNFVEFLLHFSAQMAKVYRGKHLLYLSDRFSLLLSDCISHNALAIEQGEIRKRLSTDTVSRQWSQHKVSLQRVFKKYSTMDASVSGGAHHDTMNYSELIILMRDMGLVGKNMLSDRLIRNIFFGSQQNSVEQGFDTALPDSTANASEMIYDEFLESLGAIAFVVMPDPYISTRKKITNFLDNWLVPFIKSKMRS
jgi:hypothetical protein